MLNGYHAEMKLEFNPSAMRKSMSLWRDTVDMKVALRDDIRIHLFAERAAILGRFGSVATNWLTLLNDCHAVGHDLDELNALRAEVNAFKDRAESELASLQQMGHGESLTDGESCPPPNSAAPPAK